MLRTTTITAIAALAISGTTLTPSASGSSATNEDQRTENAAKTAIQPGTLDKGKRPQALYMQGRRIYDGKRSFKVRGPKGLYLVGKGDGGYLTVRYGQYHGRLWQVRPQRKARPIAPVLNAGYNGGDRYWVNDAGNRLVITEPDRSGGMMWVRALPSGKNIRFKWVDYSTTPVLFPKNRVLLSNYRSTFWYAPKKNENKRIASDSAIVADRDRNRMVVDGDKGEPNFRLVQFRDPSQEVATWSKGRPISVSPDGKRLLAKVGKNRLQIRSLADGHLVRAFSAATRINAPRWESNRRVLFTAKGHKVAANVRCTIGGDCVRTTRLVKRPGQLGLEWPG